jgi:hypothetical protein
MFKSCREAWVQRIQGSKCLRTVGIRRDDEMTTEHSACPTPFSVLTAGEGIHLQTSVLIIMVHSHGAAETTNRTVRTRGLKEEESTSSRAEKGRVEVGQQCTIAKQHGRGLDVTCAPVPQCRGSFPCPSLPVC